MGIEKANPLFPGVELNNELVASSTQFNEQFKNMDICPQPFFTMQVNPDGYVVPCYSVDYPMMFGNIKRKSLEQIWNSTTFKIFRKKMVTEGRSCMRVCKNCTIAECRYNKEDDLDAHKKHLLDIYS
jgi:radical SAM protein with 4Fe4S-binding SPASM domain